MDYNFGGLFLDLIFTAFLYLLVPFIIFYRSKKKYEEKEFKKILIYNSSIIALFFIILRASLSIKDPVRSFAPALFYYYINKTIWFKKRIKKGKKWKRKKTNIKKTRTAGTV